MRIAPLEPVFNSTCRLPLPSSLFCTDRRPDILTVHSPYSKRTSQGACGLLCIFPSFSMADALQDTLRNSFPCLLSHIQQRSAQLTIFYSGSVKVYENVPADKAHAVMLLLGSCNENKNRALSVAEPWMPNTKNAMGGDVTAAASHLKVSTTGLQSLNRTSCPSSQHTSPQSERKPQVVCRRSQAELPYARKASLARFLEKRKDRVQATASEDEALSEEASKRMKLSEQN